MKSLAALFLMIFPVVANATWGGKFDLLSDPSSFVGFDFADKKGYGGFQKVLFKLTEDDAERLHFGGLLAWGTDRGNPLLGGTFGLPTGDLGRAVQTVFNLVAPDAGKSGLAAWLSQASVVVSLEGWGAYRLKHQDGYHDLAGGVGAKVAVPISSVFATLTK